MNCLISESLPPVSLDFSLTSAYLGTFGSSLFNFLNFIIWLRITDEGSVPEMRIWSILFFCFFFNIYFIIFIYHPFNNI